MHITRLFGLVSCSFLCAAAVAEDEMFPFVPSYDSPCNVVNMEHDRGDAFGHGCG